MQDIEVTVEPETAVNSINCSSCGTQLVAAMSSGKFATIDIIRHPREAQHQSWPNRNPYKYEAFHGPCFDAIYQQLGRQLILCCGDTIKLIDQRVSVENHGWEVAQTCFAPSQHQNITRLATHRGGNIFAAASVDGAKLFDLRNMSATNYRCLYTCKPQHEQSKATVVRFHPVYQDVLIVGDEGGDINFYDLKFSNAAYGFEKIFQEDAVDQFRFATTQEEPAETAQLYSIGSIKGAHRQTKGNPMSVVDLDVHPSGVSMATTGKDREARFWTYPGAGSLLNDTFHGGSVDPQSDVYVFNQSHKDLANEQDVLKEKLMEIERLPTREGEDVFTREDVQDMMSEYINTADQRQRREEEKDHVRPREMHGK